MKMFRAIGEMLRAWTGSAATALIAVLDRVVSPRVVRLVEADDGNFVVEATGKHDGPARVALTDGALSVPHLTPLLKGSRIEIVLKAERFLFRSLELPARAADFLEGIVRAQIDRLTPWSAADAVFGCSPPAASGTERITTVIAATTRKVATAHVQAVSGFHPAAIAISAEAGEPDRGRIKVFEQSARGHLDVARVGRALLLTLGACTAVALISVAAAAWIADSLDADEAELARQISVRRTAIRLGADGGDRAAAAGLERRKFETPSGVIMLEALSRVLPDHTYVTELHMAGGKLQISGITRDAPSLIPLIEQSRHFTRATFYAPTTRAPSDPGERFHIEMRVEPMDTVAP
jgi:general secretion pathway protein L